MRAFLVLLLVCLGSFFNPAYAEGDCSEDPRACFDGFEEDGTIKTKSGKAERTFSMPALKAGFIVDVWTLDVLPHMSIELRTFELPWLGDFSLDTGVATSRLFVSVTWELIPFVKIGPSLWAGYHVREEVFAGGVGVSILDF
jgi:hypothetical protein